jgi:hypothetical protein
MGLVIALVPIACSAKVLSFTPTASSADALVASVGSATAVADLTDEQANQVCAWLATSYPSSPGELPLRDCQTNPYFPGRVFCSALGLPTALDNGNMFAWPAIAPESACVANLRHSACQATITSLTQCAEYVSEYALYTVEHDSNTVFVPHNGTWAACSEFANAADCGETVFNSDHSASNENEATFCAGDMPVAPNTQCAMLSSLGGSGDAGSD